MTNKLNKPDIEAMYSRCFAGELDRRAEEGYVVVGKNPDGSRKEYADTGAGKFYLCGFASIHYDCSTPEGRNLHKVFKDAGFEPVKNYYGGFNIHLDNARTHGNGMFEIMVNAYWEVIKYISEVTGLSCMYVQSNLD